jgi:hypothetical protein
VLGDGGGGHVGPAAELRSNGSAETDSLFFGDSSGVPRGLFVRAMMGLPPYPDIVRIHRRRCESVGGVGQLDHSGVRRNPNIECLGGRILPI